MSRKKGTPKSDHDDIDLVADEEFEVEQAPSGQIKRLREKLKECQAEKSEYLTGWQRAKADYVNVQAEHQRSLTAANARAKAALIEDLLPTLDAFTMAMQGDAWHNVDEKWRVGVEHIYRQYEEALTNHGLSIIDPLGETFNPQEQQAVEEVAVEQKKDDHKVQKVLQKGYKLGDTLIRAARVVVGVHNS